jgi:hypothetical protein
MPSEKPSFSAQPSAAPSEIPSQKPSISAAPSTAPSEIPSQEPSVSVAPSATPSVSAAPSEQPSAAPSVTNDACAIATDLGTATGSFDFDTSSAKTGPDIGCFMENDIWFLWTASANGIAVVDTCDVTTEFDTVLAVYESCSGSTALGCNDDFCGLQSKIHWTVVLGTTYAIRIGGFGSRGTGKFKITLNDSPGGDTCDLATDLGTTTGTFNFDTSFATTDFGLECFMENDIWFLWTASADGIATADTCDVTTEFDTALAVYEGCSRTLALNCNDDFCGLQSKIEWKAVSGTTYAIRIGGADFFGGAGKFLITQQKCEPCFNRIRSMRRLKKNILGSRCIEQCVWEPLVDFWERRGWSCSCE